MNFLFSKTTRNKQDNSWSANILPVYPRWKRDHNPESKDDCFATCKCALPLLRLYLFIILFLVLFWYNFFPSFNVYLLQLLYDFFQGTHEVRSLCAGQSMLQSYIKHFFFVTSCITKLMHQSFHVVRMLEKVMLKIYTCMLKFYYIKSWWKKVVFFTFCLLD